MTSTMVTVGGSDTRDRLPDDRPPGSRPAVFAAAGIATGLIMGVLFTGGPSESAGPTDETVVDEPDASPTTVVITTTTTDPPPARLATLVPGMLDTMVTAATDRTGSLVVTAWDPSGRTPSTAGLPHGDFVADTSREWLALSDASRFTDQQTLWVGNEAYMEPVASRVIGPPVWHARLPGQLSWVEAGDDGPVVRRARFIPGLDAIPVDIVLLDPGVALVWWNDVGMVTLDPRTGRLSLIADGGEVRSTFDVSAVVATGPGLMAVTTPDGIATILDQNLDPVRTGPWDADCSQGAFSPIDAESFATVCNGPAGERFEYWRDATADTGPTFVVEDTDLADFGFTSGGLAYVGVIDPLRPATAISFYNPIDDRPSTLSYPGRVAFIEMMRG